MAGMVDGLGFEELGQAGSQVASLFMTGSITTQSNVNVAGTISGAGTINSSIYSGGNVFSNEYVIGSGVEDRRGTITSTVLASGARVDYDATTYAGLAQAGYVTMSAGSEVWVELPHAFAGSYVVTANQYEKTGACGSTNASVSGCLYTGSFCLVGQASAEYAWIAVGVPSDY